MSDSDESFLATEFAKLAEPVLPDNLWQYIERVCPPDLYEQNHFDIVNHMPYALEDSAALINATLTALPALKDASPLLVYGHKHYPVTEFYEYFQFEEQVQIKRVKDQWHRMLVEFNGKDKLFLLLSDQQKFDAIRKQMPMITELSNANLNQHTRDHMREMWEDTKDSLRRVVELAYRRWSNVDAEFSLRPLHLMASTHVPAIIGSSPVAGLQHIDQYLSRAQLEFNDRLDNWMSGGWSLFDGSPWPIDRESMSRAIVNRAQAHQWYAFGGNAMLRMGGRVLALTRANLPPWLMVNSTSRFVIRSDRNEYDTLLLNDTINEYCYHDVDSLQQVRFPTSVIFHRIDATFMQVIAMGMSLMSTQIKLGSGNRKPTWLHTPMNRAAINAYAYKLKEALAYVE